MKTPDNITELREYSMAVTRLYRILRDMKFTDIEEGEFADRVRAFADRLQDEKILHDHLYTPAPEKPVKPPENGPQSYQAFNEAVKEVRQETEKIIGIDPNDPDLTMEQKLDLYMRSNWR